MKVLTTSNSNQTLKFIPRTFTTDIVIKLRDDSTNSNVSFIFPQTQIINDYLQVTNIFDLKEGHFYDFVVYKVAAYSQFKERVIADAGSFESGICVYNFLEAENLISQNDLSTIYKDKIFCTNQTINQDTNSYYSVNQNEYVSKAGNNDFIVL